MGLAFTNVAQLVVALGEYQPWVAVPAWGFAQLLRSAGVQHVDADPARVDDVRTWTHDALADAANVVLGARARG